MTRPILMFALSAATLVAATACGTSNTCISQSDCPEELACLNNVCRQPGRGRAAEGTASVAAQERSATTEPDTRPEVRAPGWLAGDIGPNLGIWLETSRVEVRRNANWTNIQVVAEPGSNGTIEAMGIVSTILDLAQLPDGSYPLNAENLGVQGCSNIASDGTQDWFDAPAESGEMTLAKLPSGDLELAFRVALVDAGGTFQMRARVTPQQLR